MANPAYNFVVYAHLGTEDQMTNRELFNPPPQADEYRNTETGRNEPQESYMNDFAGYRHTKVDFIPYRGWRVQDADEKQ